MKKYVIAILILSICILNGCSKQKVVEPPTPTVTEEPTTPTEEPTPTEEVMDGYIKAKDVTLNLSEVKDNFTNIYNNCLKNITISDSDDMIVSIKNMPGWEDQPIEAGTFDISWISSKGYKCIQKLTIINDLPAPEVTADDITISIQELDGDLTKLTNLCINSLHFENIDPIEMNTTNIPETIEVGEYVITWTSVDGSLSCDQKVIIEDITPTEEIEITEEPTPEVTAEPTVEPTKEITPEPTKEVTPEPTKEITPEPTSVVTEVPTAAVTEEPTKEPTPEVTSVEQNDKAKLTTDKITFSLGSTSEDAAIAAFTSISVTGTTQYASVDQNELYAVLDALAAGTTGKYVIHYNAMDGSFSLPLTVIIEE